MRIFLCLSLSIFDLIYLTRGRQALSLSLYLHELRAGFTTSPRLPSQTAFRVWHIRISRSFWTIIFGKQK